VKVKVGKRTRDVRAVSMDARGRVVMIDQRLLPHRLAFVRAETPPEVARAIKTMVIRGAPSIGAAAAYGMAQARLQRRDVSAAARTLKAARPTAFDLFFAVDWMAERLAGGADPRGAADLYAQSIVDRCRAIGGHGAPLIKQGAKLLTHCNAGALATVDYGTALAPMRVAREEGTDFFVWVDETRPRLQGAKLTAWELLNEGIPHAVIADNAAGHFIRRGEVDLVITGADRIARNGDFANKIGTYSKAVVARENGVPFFVAAPLSTFDFGTATGRSIEIEERAGDEVARVGHERLTPRGSPVANPAFDVTPANLVRGFVTEYGVIRPAQVASLGRKARFGPLGAGH
jgi:S-methyl-5-thioribose-1-phosphate isomerase